MKVWAEPPPCPCCFVPSCNFLLDGIFFQSPHVQPGYIYHCESTEWRRTLSLVQVPDTQVSPNPLGCSNYIMIISNRAQGNLTLEQGTPRWVIRTSHIFMCSLITSNNNFDNYTCSPRDLTGSHLHRRKIKTPKAFTHMHSQYTLRNINQWKLIYTLKSPSGPGPSLNTTLHTKIFTWSD